MDLSSYPVTTTSPTDVLETLPSEYWLLGTNQALQGTMKIVHKGHCA